ANTPSATRLIRGRSSPAAWRGTARTTASARVGFTGAQHSRKIEIMNVRKMIVTGAILVMSGLAARSQHAGPLVERVADTGFIQLESPSFQQLDARQKALAYWLTQASIAIDPIIYDQLSAFGIRQKRLLEEIVGHRQGIPDATFAKIRSYALLFWANRGNHNE